MIMPNKSGRQDDGLHVGDEVSFDFGLDRVRGKIIEDLGGVGKGGRRLYLVEFTLLYTDPMHIPLGDEELTLESKN